MRAVKKRHEDRICDICGDVGYKENLVICFQCNTASEHIYCMRNVGYVASEPWCCEKCSASHRVHHDGTLNSKRKFFDISGITVSQFFNAIRPGTVQAKLRELSWEEVGADLTLTGILAGFLMDHAERLLCEEAASVNLVERAKRAARAHMYQKGAKNGFAIFQEVARSDPALDLADRHYREVSIAFLALRARRGPSSGSEDDAMAEALPEEMTPAEAESIPANGTETGEAPPSETGPS